MKIKRLSNYTPAEKELWKHLCNKKLLNKNFKKQVKIKGYKLDFYCEEKSLAIELDGSVHNIPSVALKDKRRQKVLEELGIRILRFENKEVFENIDFILDTIKNTLNE